MQSNITRIKFWVLFLIGFMLTFYIFLTPPCIILFVVLWLAEGDLKRKFTACFKNKYALLFMSLYVIYLFGMLYTQSVQHGWMDLQIKLSIILFPLVLSSEPKMDFKKQKQFGFAFISGAVIHGIYCLAIASYLYFVQGKMQFTYLPFSKFVHPTYYSMYIDMAFVFMYYALTEKSNELTKREKWYIYVYAPFLLIILILLESKMGTLITVLLLGIFTLKYFLSKYSALKTSIIVLVIMAVVIAGVFKFSRFNALDGLINTEKVDVTSVESNQARVLVSRAAVEIIKKKPVIGYGTGDTVALMNQYKADGMTGIYHEKLNTHNQYLQVMVALGIPGILILLGNLLVPAFISIKEKRFVYAMFLLILILNFLTESMLEQQAGTMFYGLMNSLLMFNFVI